MAITLNVLDVRKFDLQFAFCELQNRLAQIDNKNSLWLINDREPIEWYTYLRGNDFNSQTFMISHDEYRIFISRN
ncbi:hypothetical protein [Saccharicrinis fermentans]|uniref:DUF2249 domain-containing protein n=1 Tax=Saccharicrinis fermentans DSM 9555 = JCM 21142 TaxID=869213 RepID=W7Y180_9BACT|nr:hypothetical protein [Saccharicrinis fermentans]GAF04670.1 hypothetical protein JCM21142_93384 [Saccharicrinis fermentans DSM 9555 = JCM 21142]